MIVVDCWFQVLLERRSVSQAKNKRIARERANREERRESYSR